MTRRTPVRDRSRSRLRHEDRRAQLIALGVDMLSTRTLDELSVEQIAKAAGISRGLLFHYFSSKADFHLEVVKAAAAELLEVTEPDLTQDPIAQLEESVAAFVDYVAENKAAYLSLVRGAASGDAAMREVFDQTRRALASRVFDRSSLIGAPQTPRVEIAVRGWVAFVEEVSVVWLTEDEGQVSRDELLELCRNALIRLLTDQFLPPEENETGGIGQVDVSIPAALRQ